MAYPYANPWAALLLCPVAALWVGFYRLRGHCDPLPLTPACLLTHLCHFANTPGHHGQRPPVNLRRHSQMDNKVRLCKNQTESICVLGYVYAHI